VDVAGFQIWKVSGNILKKQLPPADMGWSSSLGLGKEPTTLRRREEKGMLRNAVQGLVLGQIHWIDLSNGKRKFRT
jgi:hypothetical protein